MHFFFLSVFLNIPNKTISKLSGSSIWTFEYFNLLSSSQTSKTFGQVKNMCSIGSIESVQKVHLLFCETLILSSNLLVPKIL